MMMPTLLLDVGNTFCKAAWYESNSGLHVLPSLATNSTIEAWHHFFSQLTQYKLQQAVGVCVAGTSIQSLIHQALTSLNKAPVQWLSGASLLNQMINSYETPETLGADRYLGAYGASQTQDTAHSFVLATLGTATTVDWITYPSQKKSIPHYEYQGGLILPGLELMLKSLNHGTAQLPPLSPLQIQTVHIPQNTSQAILHGAHLAQIASIEQFYARCAQGLSTTPTLYIAGGLAKHLEPMFNLPVQRLEHPVLDGLAQFVHQHPIY